MRRRVVAVGDLHGDVHRLVRILERQEVFLPGTRTWSRAGATSDVILLGDYVDWRGEPLEGDRDTWDRGSADLLLLLEDLHRQVAQFPSTNPNNRPRLYTLLGNHDKLMLDSYHYLAEMPETRRAAVAEAHADLRKVRKALGLDSFLSGFFGSRRAPDRKTIRLLTWLTQGGPATIHSFGGFTAWYDRMHEGLAAFIAGMPLGVVVNDRLYSHSIADQEKWWRPIRDLEQLKGEDRDAAAEEWVWGRRIQGIDHHTGREIPRPGHAEIERMLARLGVRGVVVGHSLMQSLVPVKRYDGLVINIDLHGHPLSEPWLDQYDAG